jgi:hypothetical protein
MFAFRNSVLGHSPALAERPDPTGIPWSLLIGYSLVLGAWLLVLPWNLELRT